MMNSSRASQIALSVALATAACGVPSSPVDAATAPNIACGSADAMMASRGAPNVPRATGDIDKDFATAMLAQNRTMMALAKIEVECGKNPQAKAAAQAFLDEAVRHMETMNLILHTN
ncbi:MAG: hypothetical protein NVS3B16_16850 [Vulcanimicrobiaceae bacterium]